MTLIVSLEAVKKQLDITRNTHDAELLDYIAAVTAPIEEFCGPVIPRTVTRYITAYGRELVLPDDNVVSVTSLNVDGLGATTFTDFTVRGPLIRSPYGRLFTGDYAVTYVAGFDPIPPEISLAARFIVADWWRTQRGAAQGGAVAAGSTDDYVEVPGFAEPVSRFAAALLAKHRRIPGIA